MNPVMGSTSFTIGCHYYSPNLRGKNWTHVRVFKTGQKNKYKYKYMAICL